MDHLKSKIASVLGKEAAPINVIAARAGVSIATASKYCHILEAEKQAKIARLGNMKMVKLK